MLSFRLDTSEQTQQSAGQTMDRNEIPRSSSPAAELDRRNLDEDVAGALRQGILTGDLKPGERLTELDLAARWRVSQGTIRAALRTLQFEGLVEVRPRRGTFVTKLDEADVIEIYSLRDTLESLASRHAAERITDKDRRTLERVLRAMRSAVEAGNRKRMLELDFEFHRTIVEISGHKRLMEMWSRLAVQTRLFLTMTDQFHHDLDGLLSIHEPLAEAILAGKAEKAFRLASHHSQRDGTRLAAALANAEDKGQQA
ncbi:MAG: GntR family transcriptional regulator [Hyphomicrobiaceae bacterium]